MNFYEMRPPEDAGEREQLVTWLDLQRALVRHKLEGLAEADEQRSVFPTSPLMTPAGLVSHLRWDEHLWFNVIFLNEGESENPAFRRDVESADWRVDGVPLAQLLDEFEAQCARSSEITAAHSLDDRARGDDFRPSLRWILIHVIEETARHVGHLDTMRELLDGETGYY